MTLIAPFALVLLTSKLDLARESFIWLCFGRERERMVVDFLFRVSMHGVLEGFD